MHGHNFNFVVLNGHLIHVHEKQLKAYNNII